MLCSLPDSSRGGHREGQRRTYGFVVAFKITQPLALEAALRGVLGLHHARIPRSHSSKASFLEASPSALI